MIEGLTLPDGCVRCLACGHVWRASGPIDIDSFDFHWCPGGRYLA